MRARGLPCFGECVRACECSRRFRRRTEPMSADHTQAGIRPSDLNLDEMVALKEIPREERISLLNARLLAKL